MDNIKYAKDVLDPARFRDLKDFCTKHVKEIPVYNFCRKEQESSNYLEEIIRHLIGRDHPVEYWVRDTLDHTLMHVDGNELQHKIDFVRYKGENNPDQKNEFPLNTHVLYVNIDPRMDGGKLYLLPNNRYVSDRPIIDTDYEPLEGSQLIEIQPKENHMVLWADQIYHATGRVLNRDVVKHRISFMFSSWGYVPEVYRDHEHWSNYRNDINQPDGLEEPRPMEFDLK